MVKQTNFSGPIPPPSILDEYNQVVPGAANRIIEMAEKQTSHRIETEKNIVSHQILNSSRGQYMAFILAVLILIIGFVLLLLDKRIEGLALILFELVAICGVFIIKEYRSSKSKD